MEQAAWKADTQPQVVNGKHVMETGWATFKEYRIPDQEAMMTDKCEWVFVRDSNKGPMFRPDCLARGPNDTDFNMSLVILQKIKTCPCGLHKPIQIQEKEQ